MIFLQDVTSHVITLSLLIDVVVPDRRMLHLVNSAPKLLPSCGRTVLTQQVRFKKFGKWIVPHRKPRWIPMARSKMFKNPPESLIPKEEQKLIENLTVEYMRRMSALQFYLKEDDLKAGDKGEAALIAAEKEEEIHRKNLQVCCLSIGFLLTLSFTRKMKKRIKESPH